MGGPQFPTTDPATVGGLLTGREIDWIMREEETGDIYSLVQSGASLTLELVANQSGER
jgi:hypothetical protein